MYESPIECLQVAHTLLVLPFLLRSYFGNL
jgi:hypothetical protein